MGFGDPRTGVTFMNITLVAVGSVVALSQDGKLGWIGGAVVLAFLFFGAILGSWSQLLPGGPEVGRREAP